MIGRVSLVAGEAHDVGMHHFGPWLREDVVDLLPLDVAELEGRERAGGLFLRADDPERVDEGAEPLDLRELNICPAVISGRRGKWNGC